MTTAEFLRVSLLGACIGAIPLLGFLIYKHVIAWTKGSIRAKWYITTWTGVAIFAGVTLELLFKFPITHPSAEAWWWLVALTLIIVGVFNLVRTWGKP